MRSAAAATGLVDNLGQFVAGFGIDKTLLSFAGLLSLEGGHGVAAQDEDGIDRHQDGQNSI